MTITYRSVKDEALTYAEMDENFRDLRQDTTLQRVLTNGNTSNLIINIEQINASYIVANNLNVVNSTVINETEIFVTSNTINANLIVTNTLTLKGANVEQSLNNSIAQANTARDTANLGYTQANTARDTANLAFAQANTARTHANAAFVEANTSGLTLLGTVTFVNSSSPQTLAVTLTSYKQILLVFQGVNPSGIAAQNILLGNSTGDDVDILAAGTTSAIYGMVQIDLNAGIGMSATNLGVTGGPTAIRTTTTTLSFATTDGVAISSGSIRVYGVG